MKKEYRLGKLSLSSPIMNAAGTCKHIEDVEKLAKTDVGAILVGSITMKQRSENTGNTYQTTQYGTLNSLGMNNNGLFLYRKILPHMAAIAREHGKIFGVSAASVEKPEHYATLAQEAFAAGAQFVELNLGCPNVHDEGKRHPIVTFDAAAVKNILRICTGRLREEPIISLKVSPISNPAYIAELAEVINAFPLVKAVTAINTFPNGHGRDDGGANLISVSKGLAGVSGASLKLIGKGQVLQWREYLRPDIQIIAAGGIDCGKDLLDYCANGADLFQIATAYFEKGPGIFGEVLADAYILSEQAAITS